MQQTTFKLKDLKPNENNLRDGVGNVDGLADSIREEGLLQPLLIQRDGTIIAGHRRYAAMTKVFDGDHDVPVIVSDRNGEFVTTAMLIENLQREDLSPIEEAKGYQRLLDMGLTQKVISTKVGVSAPHVSKRLSLLKLPPHAAKALEAGKLTVEQGYELVKMVGAPSEMWKQAIDTPAYIPALVSQFQRAEAYAEIEEAVRDAGGVAVRSYQDVPKQRGMVAIVTDEFPLTADMVRDTKVELQVDEETGEIDGEVPYFLVSVNQAGEGIARLVEYVDKANAPEQPKHVDPYVEQRREESEHRRHEVRRLLEEVPKRTEVVAMLTDWFMDQSTHSSTVVQATAKSLDLTAVRVPDPYDETKTMPDWRVTLDEYAKQSAQKATTVLFALLVQEAICSGYKHAPEGSRALLDTLGYRLGSED